MFIFKYLYGVIDCYMDVKNTGQFCPVFFTDSAFLLCGVHPVGVEDAVEVVDLVLEDDGRESVDALRPFCELFVVVAQRDLLRPFHVAVETGDREASLAS